jgi:hypothetical protein
MSVSTTQPKFRVTDLGWLTGITILMANSNIWEWLSPRPEIGNVAVLWLPNAVLAVALLRNWGRLYFCITCILVFFAVGLYPSFVNGSMLGMAFLLGIDILEVLVLSLGLFLWGGQKFRVNTVLNVAVFWVMAVLACVVGGMAAALASQLSFADMPISKNAPLQVGVVWFMSDLATYFFLAAPLIALTGRDWRITWAELTKKPVLTISAVVCVLVLTITGFALPQWLSARTGLTPGPGGLLLIAFPLAAYLVAARGTAMAALVAAAIATPSIYATVAGIGPFGKGKVAGDIFDMQATLVICTLTLLIIAAMAEQLRERTETLERALNEAIKRKGG